MPQKWPHSHDFFQRKNGSTSRRTRHKKTLLLHIIKTEKVQVDGFTATVCCRQAWNESDFEFNCHRVLDAQVGEHTSPLEWSQKHSRPSDYGSSVGIWTDRKYQPLQLMGLRSILLWSSGARFTTWLFLPFFDRKPEKPRKRAKDFATSFTKRWKIGSDNSILPSQTKNPL